MVRIWTKFIDHQLEKQGAAMLLFLEGKEWGHALELKEDANVSIKWRFMAPKCQIFLLTNLANANLKQSKE